MSSNNRMQYLDLLRGFAILGILISNLPVIAEPPFGLGLSHTDFSKIVTSLGYFFVTGKFFLIFSFVFGYGFTILLKSSEAKGMDSKRIFQRRLVGLTFFGIIHACFFFNGDILITYSILGFMLYYFRDYPLNKILRLSFTFWIISALFYGIIGIVIFYSAKEDPTLTRELTIHSIQGYLGNFKEASFQRIQELQYTFPFIILFNWPSAFFLFLIGLWFGKQNVLQKPENFFDKLKGYWIYILLTGIFGNVMFVWGNLESLHYILSFICNAFLAVGGISFALIYCFILFRFSKLSNKITFFCNQSIEAVGSMSLSNYILQSILLSWFFNGWGLGFYGQLPPEIYMLLVFPVYGINITFSVLWKKYFSLGPLEYILRKFTYG